MNKNILITIGIIAILGAGMLLLLGEQMPEDELVAIELYYPNEVEAEDVGDECDPDSVVALNREVELYEATPHNAIALLVEGELTDGDREAGFYTDLPHEGLHFVGSRFEEGPLELEFTEVPGVTSGDECLVTILRTQIERTALSFDEVDEVVLLPEGIFQP